MPPVTQMLSTHLTIEAECTFSLLKGIRANAIHHCNYEPSNFFYSVARSRYFTTACLLYISPSLTLRFNKESRKKFFFF